MVLGEILSADTCGSSTNWAGTSWSDGVTEPGSSGAAVYRNSDQKLFGVLTCDNLEQAIHRAGAKLGNAGRSAMMTGVEMANLVEAIND